MNQDQYRRVTHCDLRCYCHQNQIQKIQYPSHELTAYRVVLFPMLLQAANGKKRRRLETLLRWILQTERNSQRMAHYYLGKPRNILPNQLETHQFERCFSLITIVQKYLTHALLV